MQSDIRREVDSNAETGFTYTHVLNGFSIEAYAEDIERIKALPNVENVYISRTHEIYNTEWPDSGMYIDSGCEMMNVDYMQNELDVTGEGMVIAVIDNGFDVGHENFQGSISGARLSKQDIAGLIESESLSIN